MSTVRGGCITVGCGTCNILDINKTIAASHAEIRPLEDYTERRSTLPYQSKRDNMLGGTKPGVKLPSIGSIAIERSRNFMYKCQNKCQDAKTSKTPRRIPSY